jgi:hypothetical protein
MSPLPPLAPQQPSNLPCRRYAFRRGAASSGQRRTSPRHPGGKYLGHESQAPIRFRPRSPRAAGPHAPPAHPRRRSRCSSQDGTGRGDQATIGRSRGPEGPGPHAFRIAPGIRRAELARFCSTYPCNAEEQNASKASIHSIASMRYHIQTTSTRMRPESFLIVFVRGRITRPSDDTRPVRDGYLEHPLRIPVADPRVPARRFCSSFRVRFFPCGKYSFPIRIRPRKPQATIGRSRGPQGPGPHAIRAIYPYFPPHFGVNSPKRLPEAPNLP